MANPPKWPIALLPDIGVKALELAKEYRSVLEPRLPPGIIDGLSAGLAELDTKKAAAAVVPTALKAATLTQNDAAAAGYQLVSAARRAVSRVGGKADAKAFGVGEVMRRNSTPQVLTGLAKFLDGATARPEVARAAGILPADLEAARALRLQLVDADAAQGQLKAKRLPATAARDAAAKAVASHVDAILAAADIAFYAQPEILALFHSVVPSKRKATKRTTSTRGQPTAD